MEIHSLREMYAGRSCFLICDGPSFKKVDKHLLATPGVLTAGVNNAPASFRTDLWIFADSPEKFLGSLKADPRVLKFCRRSHAKHVQPPKVLLDLNTDYDPDTYLAEPTVSFGRKSGEGGVRSIMMMALKTLYLLGFKNVYLLGVDFEMAEGAENYHFEQETGESHVRMNNRAYKVLSDRFKAMKPHFDRAGFHVWNCNHESKLKVFPFVDIEEAVISACADMPDPANESTVGMYNRLAQAPPRIPRRALRTIDGKKLKVICVLKSGGDYDADDVANLKRHVANAVAVDYEFVCYSDIPEIADRPLRYDFPGWWSKVEIFREAGPCIFFDLDVAIPGSISQLVDWVLADGRRIAMLEDWNPAWRAHTWNSTIVAWHGDYSYLLREFDLGSDKARFRGDQEYISARLKQRFEEVRVVDEIQTGVYSYKVHCREGAPNDTEVICFHGRPRPRHIGAPYWIPTVKDVAVLSQMDRMEPGRRGHEASGPGLVEMISVLPAHGTMVEVGCFRGISTSIFAHYFDHVATVDRWGSGKVARVRVSSWEDVRREAHDRLANYSNVEIIEGESVETAGRFPDGSLDFIYLDCSTTYEAAKKDIQAWLPKLKPTGVLGGHDYRSRAQGVVQAVNELGAPRIFSDTSWFISIADLQQATCRKDAEQQKERAN